MVVCVAVKWQTYTDIGSIVYGTYLCTHFTQKNNLKQVCGWLRSMNLEAKEPETTYGYCCMSPEEAGHGHVKCQEFQIALQRQYRFWLLIADLCRACPWFVVKTLKHALEMLQRVVRRIEEKYFSVSWHRPIVFSVPRSF